MTQGSHSDGFRAEQSCTGFRWALVQIDLFSDTGSVSAISMSVPGSTARGDKAVGAFLTLQCDLTLWGWKSSSSLVHTAFTPAVSKQ